MHARDAGVLIIGGGLIGSSIAWRLAQRGTRGLGEITLVDAGDSLRAGAGGEASSAGAGMLSPGAESETASGGLELGVASLRLYPSFIEELQAETGREIEYRTPGCWMYPESGGQAEVQARADAHRAAGLAVEDRGGGPVASLHGRCYPLFYPEDGLVMPPELLGAVRCAAERRGVKVERRAADDVEASDFACVVIAAGAWSGGLRVTHQGKPVELPRSVPVKGHLLGFDMEPGLLGAFRRKGPSYVLQRANGLVVAGSNEERAGFDTSIDDAACREIHRRAVELLPELEGQEPVKQWAGFRPGLERSESGEAMGPRMGRVEGTNVWLAYGHYRNGILLTPVTAERVSGEIIDACG